MIKGIITLLLSVTLAAATPVEKTILDQGIFPDVAFYKNRVWVTTQKGTQKPYAVVLYSFKPDLTDQKEEKTFSSSDAAYSRLYADSNGILWQSWRDSDDKIKLWRNDTNRIETVSSEKSGANGAIMGYNKIAWHSLDFQSVFIRELTGGIVSTARTGNYPTGISRILPNGEVIYTDEDRTLFDWGLDPSFAGILTIAVDQKDGNHVRFNNNESTRLNIFPGESFTPRAATDGTTNYAAVTWGKPGVRLAVFQGPTSNGNTERGGTGEALTNANSGNDEYVPGYGLPFGHVLNLNVPSENLPKDIGSLISTIFIWAINLVGIAVFVMFFIAGLQWFTAAGNTATTGKAKDKMKNAFLGAVLLFSAYLILYTINPDLVKGTFKLDSFDITTTTNTSTSGSGNSSTPPIDALTKHPPQITVIASVITELKTKNLDLTGPCGAFTITKNVAWQLKLKGDGGGLLSKPGGTNCQGYSVDVIAYPDGYIYDILGNAETENNPQWLPLASIDPARYTAPFDPK